MAEGKKDRLFDVTSRRQSTSSARSDKRVLRIAVYIVIAFAQPALVRAQDAVPRVLPEPTILPELSKRTGPEPMKAQGTPIPDTEKPSVEVLGGAPNEKPAPIVKQEPPPKTEAIPVAAAEKKTPPAKHTIVDLKAPAPAPAPPIDLTLSALKAVTTSAPLPDYPYQAKQAHVIGSGICNLVVDSANGKVTSATMAQSTGSKILDKVTTDTFRRWRFKPGTLSQVRVPITYE
jgi:TonB family protein